MYGFQFGPQFNQHSQRPDTCRSGFSLLELTVVIAILSVLTMVSWPMLRRPLNKSIVQDAAQQLQRDLSSTRMQAVESGRNLIFQFRPGSATYYLGDTDQRQTNSDARSTRDISQRIRKPQLATNPSVSNRDAVSSNDESVELAPKELPDGTFFDDSNANDDLKQSTPEELRMGKSETTEKKSIEVEPSEWSAPIRFYPSGRINPARVVLASEQGYFAEVEIHGIAGRVKISPIHR